MLEECVRENVVDSGYVGDVEKSDTKKYGKSEGFEEYVQSLKSMKELEEMEKEVKAGLTNVAVEPFVLESMTGKKVNSKDWKERLWYLIFGQLGAVRVDLRRACKWLWINMLKIKRWSFILLLPRKAGININRRLRSTLQKMISRSMCCMTIIMRKSQSANVVFSRFAKMFNDSGIPRKVILKDGVMRYTLRRVLR